MANQGRTFLKKATYQGHLIAPLIRLASVYPLGSSVQFTYLLSLTNSSERSLTCLCCFNQSTEMCFYGSVGCVGQELAYSLNMKMGTGTLFVIMLICWCCAHFQPQSIPPALQGHFLFQSPKNTLFVKQPRYHSCERL